LQGKKMEKFRHRRLENAVKRAATQLTQVVRLFFKWRFWEVWCRPWEGGVALGREVLGHIKKNV